MLLNVAVDITTIIMFVLLVHQLVVLVKMLIVVSLARLDFYLIQTALRLALVDNMETLKIILVELVIQHVLNVVVALSHNAKDVMKDLF